MKRHADGLDATAEAPQIADGFAAAATTSPLCHLPCASAAFCVAIGEAFDARTHKPGTQRTSDPLWVAVPGGVGSFGGAEPRSDTQEGGGRVYCIGIHWN